MHMETQGYESMNMTNFKNYVFGTVFLVQTFFTSCKLYYNFNVAYLNLKYKYSQSKMVLFGFNRTTGNAKYTQIHNHKEDIILYIE